MTLIYMVAVKLLKNTKTTTKTTTIKTTTKTTATTLRHHVMIFKLPVEKFIMVVVTCCKFMIKLIT